MPPAPRLPGCPQPTLKARPGTGTGWGFGCAGEAEGNGCLGWAAGGLVLLSQPRVAVPSQVSMAWGHSTSCPLPGCGSVLPRSKPARGSTRSVPRLCPRPSATSSSWLGVWCPRMSPGLAARALCWQHGGLLSPTPSSWWAARCRGAGQGCGSVSALLCAGGAGSLPGGCLQGCQSLRFSSPADFCSSNAERKTCL